MSEAHGIWQSRAELTLMYFVGHAQLLVYAAEQGSGHKKTFIPEEEAKFSFQQVGTSEKGWLAFQPYYDEILAKTDGSFLK